MTKLYQGILMAAIILSAGIIGQIDAAEEKAARQENNAEAYLQADQTDELYGLAGRTNIAQNERDPHLP